MVLSAIDHLRNCTCHNKQDSIVDGSLGDQLSLSIGLLLLATALERCHNEQQQ